MHGCPANGFCVAVTSTFRVFYVLVVIEHHSRRLIHVNVTAHLTAQWTRQLREAVGYEKQYAYLLHDRENRPLLLRQRPRQLVPQLGNRVGLNWEIVKQETLALPLACVFRPCRSPISRDAGRSVHRMPVGE